MAALAVTRLIKYARFSLAVREKIPNGQEHAPALIYELYKTRPVARLQKREVFGDTDTNLTVYRYPQRTTSRRA